MSDSLLFSVVIPTYHRNDLLAKCLDRLAPGHQTLAPECYEVIVTDDGSGPTAEKLIQNHYPWVKWVAGPRRGPAANRNNGAKSAQGDWLVFTDDDCLPDMRWLEIYSHAVSTHKSYQIFEGRTYVDRPRQSLAEKAPANESGGYLWSCNFTIKREFFRALGGFDERFPYAAMEDVEFRYRILKAKQSFLFLKEASVCHPWRIQTGWKRFEQASESIFLYLSIHPEEKTRINQKHFVFKACRKLIKEFLPGSVLYYGNGSIENGREIAFFIYMAFLISIRP